MSRVPRGIGRTRSNVTCGPTTSVVTVTGVSRPRDVSGPCGRVDGNTSDVSLLCFQSTSTRSFLSSPVHPYGRTKHGPRPNPPRPLSLYSVWTLLKHLLHCHSTLDTLLVLNGSPLPLPQGPPSLSYTFPGFHPSRDHTRLLSRTPPLDSDSGSSPLLSVALSPQLWSLRRTTYYVDSPILFRPCLFHPFLFLSASTLKSSRFSRHSRSDASGLRDPTLSRETGLTPPPGPPLL